MRSFVFIAMLFCMAAAALLVGGIALYENVDFRLHGRQATMELADPARRITIPTGGYDVHLLDVRYVTQSGTVTVPQKQLVGDVARAIASGGKVAVSYYTNDPQRVRYPGDELPAPWGWLLLSAIFGATFVYAVKLRRLES